MKHDYLLSAMCDTVYVIEVSIMTLSTAHNFFLCTHHDKRHLSATRDTRQKRGCQLTLSSASAKGCNQVTGERCSDWDLPAKAASRTLRTTLDDGMHHQLRMKGSRETPDPLSHRSHASLSLASCPHDVTVRSYHDSNVIQVVL